MRSGSIHIVLNTACDFACCSDGLTVAVVECTAHIIGECRETSLSCLTVSGYMCQMFITPRVHGGFYGLDLKIDMVV